jgi:hypothetical protein
MYEEYTRQPLPPKKYRELLGSALCVFNNICGARYHVVLTKNGIHTVSQLIQLFDSGAQLDGLGEKSQTYIRNLFAGMDVNILSAEDDVNFVFRFLGIKRDIKNLKIKYDVVRLLDVTYHDINFQKLNRNDFYMFLKKQKNIAVTLFNRFLNDYDNAVENIKLLRKDEKSIYLSRRFSLN